MNGIPGPLLNKLKKTMLECGPFATQDQLLAVFADKRIASWRYEVPEAGTVRNRVDYFVSKFFDRYNRLNQNVLVLFLQAYYDGQSSMTPEDKCIDRLYDIGVEMAAVVESHLPPLTRQNLVRAAIARTGEMPADNVAGYIQPVIEPDRYPFFDILPDDLTANNLTVMLESLKNKKQADWLPVSFLEKALTAAHAVGRVEYQDIKIGTAFLIAPDLVITNAHVMRHIPKITDGGVRFNVGLTTKDRWHYFVEQIVDSPVEELDFALLRLEKPAVGLPLTFSEERSNKDQPANILQYPNGDLMQVALRYNAIVHTNVTRFYYVADTEEGSSGSPIFNDDWQVIGIHRAGIVNKDHRPVKNANQGVPSLAIQPLIRPYLTGDRS